MKRRISQKHVVFVVCVIAVANLPVLAAAPCTTNQKSMRSLAASLQARSSALALGGQLAFNVVSHPNTSSKSVIVRQLHEGNTIFAIEASGIAANELTVFPYQQGQRRAFAFRTVDVRQGYREVCLYEFYFSRGHVTVHTALTEGSPAKRSAAVRKDIPDVDRSNAGRKWNNEDPDAYDPNAFAGSNFNKNIAGVIGRKPSAEELAALRSTGGLDDPARANMDHHSALIIAIKASKTPLTHEQIQNILGHTALAEGGPTRRSSASQAQPASAQLDPMWYGTWKNQYGTKTLTISASKIIVSEVRHNDKGKPERVRYEHHWVNKSEPEDGSFGRSTKRISPGVLAKRYQEAVEQYKRDSADFNISDPAMSRAAIGAISPGVYKIMWSYAGGDCAYWEYIVDKDKMLEINECKYRFGVQLLNRDVR